MTRIKICGLTRLTDAEQAAALDVDFLGFILYPPSARYVTPAQIRTITDALRASFGPRRPRFVGVFVNTPADEVAARLDEAGLDLAQLHGEESPAALRALAPRAYKAVRPQAEAQALAALDTYGDVVNAQTQPQLLVDAYHPEHYGGTGHRTDVAMAQTLARRCRLMLAGGLTPQNVGDAVRQIRPWGVDVSSGVEREKGIKDPARLRAFVHAARAVPHQEVNLQL